MSHAPAEVARDRGQRYGEWAAPKHAGALLIWPDADTLGEIARDNAAALDSAKLEIDGIALAALRIESRRFLNLPTDRPLILTGHQSELHHPGVWVKNVLVDAVARACDGAAVHLALDTDTPKHLKLKWPGFAVNFTDDPRLHGRPWTGLVEPPSPAHLQTLIDAADAGEANGAVGPLLGEFLRRCRAFVIDQHDAVAPLDLPSMLANAEHELDWGLGLDYALFTMSGLAMSPPWLRFVRHLACDADRFVAAYNAALDQHRADAGIDDPERPMPNLVVGDGEVELPFWLDDLDAGTRVRATVSRGRGRRVLAGFDLNGDADALLAHLRRRRLRLSSRALSLTTFARLCLGDLFVHGIGGGHYDQVADRVIETYFGLKPPTFAVSTATLFHPNAADRERVCPPCIVSRGHRLRHRVLGDAKQRWLDRINAASGFKQRRAIFRQMHAALATAREDDTDYQRWRAEEREAERRLAEEAVLFDRELFYLVQPPSVLKDLIQRVRGEVSGS